MTEPPHFYAPDWTRTSTPSRAQALNLLRIPIPPQGLWTLLYSLGSYLSTRDMRRAAARVCPCTCHTGMVDASVTHHGTYLCMRHGPARFVHKAGT